METKLRWPVVGRHAACARRIVAKIFCQMRSFSRHNSRHAGFARTAARSKGVSSKKVGLCAKSVTVTGFAESAS